MPEAETEPAAPPEASKQEGTDEVKPTESQRGPPPGVAPLFFSGPSQQIFGCVVDVDLTDQNPHKLIPKVKILEDFKNRAAVCDFHPVKQKILVGINIRVSYFNTYLLACKLRIIQGKRYCWCMTMTSSMERTSMSVSQKKQRSWSSM